MCQWSTTMGNIIRLNELQQQWATKMSNNNESQQWATTRPITMITMNNEGQQWWQMAMFLCWRFSYTYVRIPMTFQVVSVLEHRLCSYLSQKVGTLCWKLSWSQNPFFIITKNTVFVWAPKSGRFVTCLGCPPVEKILAKTFKESMAVNNFGVCVYFRNKQIIIKWTKNRNWSTTKIQMLKE